MKIDQFSETAEEMHALASEYERERAFADECNALHDQSDRIMRANQGAENRQLRAETLTWKQQLHLRIAANRSRAI